MTILIFNWRDITHPYAGGAEVYLHEMARRWVKRGHIVGWLCAGYNNARKQETIDGIRIMRTGGEFGVYLFAALHYLLRLRSKYDVVIDAENGIPFFTPLYVSVPKLLLIHHIHREVFFKELRFPLSWVAYFLESKLMPLMYRKIRCVTVSKSSKDQIKELRLGGDQIAIIHNGVDSTKYVPGRKSPHPLIVYIGRLRGYKSIDVLIYAMREITKRVPEVELVIGGSGPKQEAWERLTKKLELDQKVKFYGYVAEREKIEIFQKAWVFVNPSFIEGWGVTSIEASACGTPVIASNVPGLRDSVQDGKTGFLFEYGNVDRLVGKLVEILKDEALRTKLGKNGLNWARNFSWDKSADEGLEVLGKIFRS